MLEFGLNTMPGDEAFYYKHTDGKLNGAVLTHVDDFIFREIRYWAQD